MQLYINTFGAYLHVKDDMFEVKYTKDGKEEKQGFSVKRIVSIILAPHTALSSSAVELAVKNNIDIVFSEHDGTPLGRVWHSRPSSTTKIRKAQLEASLAPLSVTKVKQWVISKVENRITYLERMAGYRKGKEEMISEKVTVIREMVTKMSALEGSKAEEIAPSLRGYEGTAGRVYFDALGELIPAGYTLNGRSMRPAKDAFNAFLNYNYAIIYRQVEKALLIAGIDPYLGFMHRDDYNQLSFVFDFIEPYRIYAEVNVFKLFSAKKVNKSHSDEIKNGVMLNPEGKKLLVDSFNSYFHNDPIRYKGRNLTRANTIQHDAHQFANELLGREKQVCEVVI